MFYGALVVKLVSVVMVVVMAKAIIFIFGVMVLRGQGLQASTRERLFR